MACLTIRNGRKVIATLDFLVNFFGVHDVSPSVTAERSLRPSSRWTHPSWTHPCLTIRNGRKVIATGSTRARERHSPRVSPSVTAERSLRHLLRPLGVPIDERLTIRNGRKVIATGRATPWGMCLHKNTGDFADGGPAGQSAVCLPQPSALGDSVDIPQPGRGGCGILRGLWELNALR